MLLRLIQFKGMAPSVAPDQLSEQMAQLASNCRLNMGGIRPVMGVGAGLAPSKSGTILSIYPYAAKWFNWITDVNCVRSPLADDDWDRRYWSGDGVPKMTVNAVATGGSDYPSVSYNLGIPAPDTPLAAVAVDWPAVDLTSAETGTATVFSTEAAHGLIAGDTVDLVVAGWVGVLTGLEITTSTETTFTVSYDSSAEAAFVSGTVTKTGTVDLLDDESRAYVYTYVSAYGEEGPPSPASGVIDVNPSQPVALSSMSAGPSGAYNITHKKIYRTNTGSSTTEYQYVMTVAVAVTEITDSVESEALGAVLASSGWDAPPADMAGLFATPLGTLCGFSGNLFCESEPYLPHAWPVGYQVPLDEDIVAAGSYGNNLLVVTTGAPYLATGSPGSRVFEKLEMGYACVSKRGFVDIGYACIYPAINGLMMAGMGNVQLATAGILTQADWQALNPASIHGYLHDAKYVGFWDNDLSEGFIYDPQTGDFVLHDIPATAGYHNPATGTLHVVSNGQIVPWEGGSAKTFIWKSKVFVMPAPHNFACAQVTAAAYPLTFKLYADGVLKHTQTVSGIQPFRLPGGFRADRYEVEVSGSSVITAVSVADSMQELGQV